MSLVGSTTTVTVTLTPNYMDGDGLPAIVTYSFDVTFSTSCPTVTSLDFTTETSDQSYTVASGLLTSDAFIL